MFESLATGRDSLYSRNWKEVSRETQLKVKDFCKVSLFFCIIQGVTYMKVLIMKLTHCFRTWAQIENASFDVFLLDKPLSSGSQWTRVSVPQVLQKIGNWAVNVFLDRVEERRICIPLKAVWLFIMHS